jgi:hypothetical protein
MNPDEERSTDSDHDLDVHTVHGGVELHNAHSVELVEAEHERSGARRRTFATIAVATCLGAAGVIIGLAVVRGERVSDERATREALEREELRDGWKTLGAAATQEAERTGEQTAAAPPVQSLPVGSAQPAQTATNIVVINVPPQVAPSATNMSVVPVPTATSAWMSPVPSVGSTPTAGSADAPNVPNVSGSTIYVPVPGAAFDGNAPPTPSVPSPGRSAPVPVPGQSVGNGTIPGAAANPDLPNGVTPVSPPTTVPGGSVPASPPSPSLPIGTVPAAP